MTNLKEYQGEDKIITFSDKREEVGKEEFKWDIRSGFFSLDAAVKGFRPGNLCIISGPTAQGKTSLSVSITNNIVKQGDKVLWFPFEGEIHDFLSRLSGVTTEGFIPKKLKSNNMLWVKQRIEEAKLKHNIKAVFLDHLHYLIDLGMAMGNSSLTMGNTVRGIVSMAREYEVVVFLVAHIRKLTTVDTQGNFRKPSMEDIRDSSLIAQECDQAILMWRKQATGSTPENPIWIDKAKISLQKNRGKRGRGKLVNFDVEMNEETQLFEEHLDEEIDYKNKRLKTDMFWEE